MRPGAARVIAALILRNAVDELEFYLKDAEIYSVYLTSQTSTRND